ncbi:MAG: streptomycin 6-kinase [Chloroflexota bacterium]|jgi:streptomycin 6-kinase|nr:streptomycin 6-kinase [Chloroflexota bacterium]
MTTADGWQWEPARRLDRVAQEVALEWELRLGPRYEWARHSFTAPAGDNAVLKVTPAEDDEADHEGDALAFWNGRGAVRLLRRDIGRRTLLIERCIPGHDVSGLDDTEAVRIALDTGRELWRPITRGPFKRAGDEMARWLRGLEQRSLHPYVAIAAKRFAAMTPRHDVLIHGDLHHHNLLRHAGRWLAIDPKPLLGEPEYDVATLLWNPLQVSPTRELTERRIAQLAAAGLDEQRIRDWAIVRGTQLGLPHERNEHAAPDRQLSVVYWLLE